MTTDHLDALRRAAEDEANHPTTAGRAAAADRAETTGSIAAGRPSRIVFESLTLATLAFLAAVVLTVSGVEGLLGRAVIVFSALLSHYVIESHLLPRRG